MQARFFLCWWIRGRSAAMFLTPAQPRRALRIVAKSTWLIHRISEVLVSQRRDVFQQEIRAFILLLLTSVRGGDEKEEKSWSLLGGCRRGASRPPRADVEPSHDLSPCCPWGEKEECWCPSHKDAGRKQTTKFFPKLVTESCVNPPRLGSESHNVLSEQPAPHLAFDQQPRAPRRRSSNWGTCWELLQLFLQSKNVLDIILLNWTKPYLMFNHNPTVENKETQQFAFL